MYADDARRKQSALGSRARALVSGRFNSERKQCIVQVDNDRSRDLGRDDIGKRCGIARVGANKGICGNGIRRLERPVCLAGS